MASTRTPLHLSIHLCAHMLPKQALDRLAGLVPPACFYLCSHGWLHRCLRTCRRTGSKHFYPASYGAPNCTAHDLQLPPDCADVSGHIRPAAPSYCKSSWCYVNPAICDKTDVRQSVYFGLDTDLWFSYAACGAVDTFSESNQYIQAAACAARTQEGCVGPCERVTSKCRDTYQANSERDLYMNILDSPVPR